jgi:hypothetical protein
MGSFISRKDLSGRSDVAKTEETIESQNEKKTKKVEMNEYYILAMFLNSNGNTSSKSSSTRRVSFSV